MTNETRAKKLEQASGDDVTIVFVNWQVDGEPDDSLLVRACHHGMVETLTLGECKKRWPGMHKRVVNWPSK